MSDFPTFIFNGLNSYDDFSIIVTKMPPIFFPKKDIESIQIEGSNKILHVDNGAYLPVNITIECVLIDIKKLDILKKLFQSVGTIEFSDNPGRLYKCCVKNQISFSKFYNSSVIREFPLQLELEPLAYSKDKITFNFSEDAEFEVLGTENSFPIIKTIGTGRLFINNVPIDFLETGITLDCERMEASIGQILKNDMVILNEYPYLFPGKNTIVLSSEIESVELEYYARWL